MSYSFIKSRKEPRLTLVGAGPGDPELLTLKAIRALESADIVLYDALVSEPILRFIPDGVPSLAVGKRAGKHSFTQQEINELIIESAFLYGHVVRLKGGDPFVFGRATEEIDAAVEYGIPYAVVPGISSALAVPASANIPVTARGVSESFWVVTGTTKEGAISGDVALAAKSKATVVILMGLKKLGEIVSLFEAEGKGDTPVAIIQNGTLPNERRVIGTLSTIQSLAEQEAMGPPAIIVIGEVVRYHGANDAVLQEVAKQFAGG
jgi:uroporphyrin-III C-methyltransferase